MLLALADHASDDGTRVFTGIKALAEKTRESERSVQYQLRRMQEAGGLILVNAGNGGRSMHSEYRISLEWIKGVIQSRKGCNPLHPQITVIEPSMNHQ